MAAAVVLLVVTLVRHQKLPVKARDLVPWRTLLVVLGLFAVVETLHAHGLGTLLADASGTGHGAGALLRVAGVGALAANGLNNLPAYLALEPAMGGDPLRIGGAADRHGRRAADHAVGLAGDRPVVAAVPHRDARRPARTIVRQGLLLAPLAVVLSTLALAATH